MGQILENCPKLPASDSIQVVSRAPAPQAAWPGVSGALPRSAWAAASIQPRKKYKTFVALGPDGQMDTLCKAEVLHLRNCSAACALYTSPPCWCLEREPKAGLSKCPQLRQPTAKTSDHSLGLIPAAAELLCARTSAEADRASAMARCCPLDRAPQGASSRAVSRAHQLHVSSGVMPGGLRINQPYFLLFLTFRAHC